jgi:hypothetical protein
MLRRAIALVGLFLFGALTPVAAAETPLMSWSAPLQLDPGSPSKFTNGTAIDCVDRHFCAAVGGNGRMVVSTDPTGGFEAWTETAIEEAEGDNLTGVSCPTATFCAVVDESGHLLTSSEPGGSAAAWSSSSIDPGGKLVDVSCPSPSFCAAIDDSRRVLVSAEPSGGSAAWNSASLLPGGELTAISCASTTLCVIVHNERLGPHGLLVSSDPLAGAGSWIDAGVDLSNHGYDVSCPTESFCAVAFWNGVLVSTDPTGGVATWHSSHKSEYVDGISCPDSGFCAGESYGGDVLASNDPTAASSTWTEFDISPNWVNLLSGIDCTSDYLCAMVDQKGFIYTSTDPRAGPHAWRRLLTGEVERSVGSPSCPTASFCAVAGTLGRIYTSTDLTSWQAATVTKGNVWSVSCSASDWCVALGEGPAFLYSDEPGAGASAWSSVSRPDGRKISCPTSGFCAMLGEEDEVLTSTEPLGGVETWTATDLELPNWRLGPNWLTQLSCPTTDLCAVGGDVGTVLASEEPSGGRATWAKSFIGGNDPYNNGAGPSVEGLDCTVASFCAATTWAGTVATTSDPLAAAGWTLSSAPATYFPGPVSCADGAPLCVAVDRNGYAVTSQDPVRSSLSWGTMEKIDGEEELNGISCAPEGTLCVASDWDGRVVVGTPVVGGGEEPERAGQDSVSSGSPSGLPPAPRPCRRTKSHKKVKRGPVIAPRHKVSNGGRGSRSRCGRLR